MASAMLPAPMALIRSSPPARGPTARAPISRGPSTGVLASAARLGLVLLLAGALGACRSSRVPITIASDPPGAEVWIDGRDSGFATPCRISLARGRDHEVKLLLPGHLPATRRIVSNVERDTIYWREMSVGMGTWNFPLFLNIHDFFEPAPLRHPLVPGRIFVRLRREADDA